MAHYQLVGRAADGSVLLAQDVVADDDAQAETIARGTLVGSPAEIVSIEARQGARLVCRVRRDVKQ
jgi:hypothetical protein